MPTPSFPYTLDRSSRRKTLAIIIHPERGVVVKAPQRMSQRRIDLFLCDKSAWVERKITEKETNPPPVPKLFVSGERLLYLGEEHKLSVIGVDRVTTPVKLSRGMFIVQVPKGSGEEERREHVENSLRKWYLHHTMERIAKRVTHYSTKLGVTPSAIKIKDHKRRWGSCTAKGVLNFNWKIIMAPREILDYLVVHELCHLKHRDHQKGYWTAVSMVLPDYKERRKWLKDNGHTLVL